MGLHRLNAWFACRDQRLLRELELLRAERNRLVQMLSLCSQPFEPATVEALNTIVDQQWETTFNRTVKGASNGVNAS